MRKKSLHNSLTDCTTELCDLQYNVRKSNVILRIVYRLYIKTWYNIDDKEMNNLRKNRIIILILFYNYILKCFILIDLKKDWITHQDIRQMDMYDELKKSTDDNPTWGLVLFSETGGDIQYYMGMNRYLQVNMNYSCQQKRNYKKR